MQQSGEWCREPQQDQQVAERRADLNCSDGESTEDADPDERRGPRYSRGHDNGEAPAPWLDDLHQRAERGAPADRGGLRGDRVRRRRAFGLDLVALAAVPRPRVVLREVEVVVTLFGLRAHQPVIRAVAPDQLGVPAALNDTPLVEDQDAVGADHARQPMCQD